MRYDKIVIEGVLGAQTYLDLSNYASYVLATKRKVEAALAEGETVYSWEYPPEAIVMIMSSGGGDAGGLLPVMQDLKKLSDSVPIIGIAYGRACSAAGMLLSSANLVVAIQGTIMGSIGIASSFTAAPIDPEEGGFSCFYTTHEGKITGLPGENKSPDEIKAYLKSISDNQFSQIEAFMEAQRPGSKAEIASLNGEVFTVGSISKQSKLFDYTASSVQEVLTTIEAKDMKNFLKMIPGGRKPALAATSPLLETDAPASLSFTAADQAASDSATARFKAFKAELMQDSEFAAKIAEQVVATMTASAAASSTPAPTSSAQPDAPTSSASAAELVSVADLMAMGARLKASQQDVLTVAQLGVTKEQAPKMLQALVAARDGSVQQSMNASSLANPEALGGEDEANSAANALVTGLKAKIAAIAKA